MASTSSPYGLRPVNLLGGRPYAGSTRAYKIASGYAVAIQVGDPVILLTGAAGGVVNRFSATTTAATATNAGAMLGVFMGCSYTDATLGKVFRQSYTGGIVATDIQAYVVDDPDALFMVQANAAAAQVAQNCNAGLIQTIAGSAVDNRISGVGLNVATLAVTATLPLRIVDFVDAPGSVVGDAFTDVIVRLNTHTHKSGAAGVLGNAPA